MEIEVTIIIPSYNRYPLNLLTLYALENQNFNPKKMEVLLIDDASTDQSIELKKYNPPYVYRYIRNEHNLGRTKTRNIGIKEARGQIIIFLDAEVLVNRNFVRNHYRHHLNHETVVVSGVINLMRTYSCLFPNFRKHQLADFTKIARKRPMLYRRAQIMLGLKRMNKHSVFQRLRKKQEPIPIINKRDIESFSIPKLSSVSSSYYKELVSTFGNQLKNFEMPWIACHTLNMSVRKELLRKVGGFDESFVGWGFEDLELGYRLFKAGAKFLFDQKIPTYHQEHPVSVKAQKREMLKNQILFQEKHPVIAVCIYPLPFGHRKKNKIIKEFQRLNSRFPNRFNHFKESLLLLLRQIPKLKVDQQPITQLFSTIKSHHIIDVNLVLTERDRIAKMGKYPHLIGLFNYLTRK